MWIQPPLLWFKHTIIRSICKQDIYECTTSKHKYVHKNLKTRLITLWLAKNWESHIRIRGQWDVQMWVQIMNMKIKLSKYNSLKYNVEEIQRDVVQTQLDNSKLSQL